MSTDPNTAARTTEAVRPISGLSRVHRPLLQRAALGAPPTQVPPSVRSALLGPGRALDPATRTDMESRFGHSFKDVRIHEDGTAAQSAREVQARAYTVGQHIVFGPGEFAPHSGVGRSLLAHELAHTVQQGGLQRASIDGVSLQQDGEYDRLERDAENAAHAALRGAPVQLAPALTPRLSRTPTPTTTTTASAPAAPISTATAQPITTSVTNMGTLTYQVTPDGEMGEPGGARRQRRFRVNTFYLPGEKGAPALGIYQRRASASQLIAVVEVSGSSARRTALWQDRAPTPTLGSTWVRAVRWTAANRDANWAGLANGSAFPQARGVTCNMDHIVELQLGGGNDPENIQALDPTPNQASGRNIWGQVRELGTAIANAFSVPSGDQIQLIFGSVQMHGAVEPHTPVAGQPNSGLMIDQEARRGVTTRPVTDDTGAAARHVRLEAAGAGGAPGAVGNDFVVPHNWGSSNRVAPLSTEPANTAASEMIPGLVLNELQYRSGSAANVAAQFDPNGNAANRGGTRLPITVSAERGNMITLSGSKTGGTTVSPVFRLRFGSTITTNIPFTYPYLSPGRITRLTPSRDGGLNWTGEIQSAVPFLPRPLTVAYEDGSLRVTHTLDRSRLRSPIPGFTLTDANLQLILAPELGAEGNLAFVIGNASRPLASGSVRIGADAGGLNGEGRLEAHIPGVDDASAVVTYRNGVWAAQIAVESSQIRLPYVERGRLQIDIDAAGIRPSGELELLLPRELGTATLGFSREGDRFIYTGRGRLRVPGLRGVDIRARYGGTQLTATASNIGFTWRGLDGQVSVTYTARNGEAGRITGTGGLTINRGNVRGEINVTLHDSGRFSGSGRVTYPFNIRGNRLEATAGINIDERQNVRVDGSLRFPQPIELFRRFGDDRSLFSMRREIPIPGASIGPVGLVAVIEGGIAARYGFGPGQLRNVELAAAFNPLAPDPDPSVSFHGELHIPANVGISGTIGGGLGVSAGIASVTGTVTITAALDLNATLGGSLDARYERSRFSISARPGIDASLDLGLSLDAHARAQAGVGSFSVGAEKTWNLGRRAVTLGRFSMHAPIAWSSDGGFQPPTLDQIEWGPPPQIDPPDLLRQLFSSANASEREV